MASGSRQRSWWGLTASGLAGGRAGAARSLVLGFVLAGLVGVFAGLAPAALAAPAAVTCGETISKPGAYALAADCSGAGITITASHVSLRLNGHTMTGTDPGAGVGVLVDDSGEAVSGARIKGPGTITNYRCGVQLGNASPFYLCSDQPGTGAGVSGSRASGLTATDNDLGIASGADDNTIEHNVASHNGDGILLIGSDNTVKHNTANDNNSEGISLLNSDSSTVKHNTASHNGFVGILLTGRSNSNTVKQNTATHNDFYGIALGGGSSTHNTVKHNIVTNNNQFGLLLAGGSDNTIKHNTANDNDEDGIFLLDSDRNTVRHNTANDNGIGIRLDQRSQDNTIKRNTAYGSSSYDLFDGNAGCDSNSWTANAFKSANQPCIH